MSKPWHTRSRRLALVLAANAWLFASCESETNSINPQQYPAAGLYTPGSTIGASDPTDLPSTTKLSNRCKDLPAPAAGAVATPGTLSLVYETQTIKGYYHPENCTAVWIETPTKEFVATIELTAGLRRPALLYFQEHACIEKPGPDVVSSATLATHTEGHDVTWNGLSTLMPGVTDVNGDGKLDAKVVPDGEYVMFIEVTETDKDPGEFMSFTFTKGPTPVMKEEPVPGGLFKSVSWSWKPGMEGSGGVGAFGF